MSASAVATYKLIYAEVGPEFYTYRGIWHSITAEFTTDPTTADVLVPLIKAEIDSDSTLLYLYLWSMNDEGTSWRLETGTYLKAEVAPGFWPVIGGIVLWKWLIAGGIGFLLGGGLNLLTGGTQSTNGDTGMSEMVSAMTQMMMLMMMMSMMTSMVSSILPGKTPTMLAK